MNKKLTISTLLTTLLIVGCGGASGGGSEDENRDKSLDTTISGTIYEDVNNNGKKDDGETGSDNIRVTITDVKGEDHPILTDTKGNYHFSRIVHGEATITIHKDTLPKDAIIKDEHKTFTHLVELGKPNVVKDIAYTLSATEGETNVTDENGTITIIQVGEIHGLIFKDFDASYDYSEGDEGLEGINVTMIDDNNYSKSTETDKDGNYVFKNVPTGTAIIQVDDSIPEMKSYDKREGRSTQNFEEDNVTVEVKAAERNKADDIGYFATSETLGIVSGTIFFDTNNNGEYNDADERLEGITVTIKDSDGITHTVESRDATGHEAYKGQYFASVPIGNVEIIVSLRDSDIPSYTKTIGYEVDNETVEAGKITYSGGFGFGK